MRDRLWKNGMVFAVIVLFVGAGVIPSITSADYDNKTGIECKDVVNTGEFANVNSDIDWWTSFHHDQQNTGYSTSQTPDDNNLLWSYTTDGWVKSSPAVADGKVYVGSHDNNVYCLDANSGDQVDQQQKKYCGWGLGIPGNGRLAQSFTPAFPILTRVQLDIWQSTGSYKGLTVSIRETLYGSDLTTVHREHLPHKIRWIEFDFDDIEVTPGRVYYIVWKQTGGGENDLVYWGYAGDDPYTRGSAWFYDGDSWYEVTQEECPNPIDFCFQTYGFPTTNPIAEFTYHPEEPDVGEEITFDASESFDPNGNIVSYHWDFGDDNTATGGTTTHTYTEWGEYSVTLTVTDNDGKTDSLTKSLTMKDAASPSVHIVTPEKGSLYIFGIEIPFIATVIIGDIDIEIEASDNESGMNHVKLWIGAKSETLWSKPYEYSWTENTFGKTTIEAVAFDNAGNQASDSITVWKFF